MLKLQRNSREGIISVIIRDKEYLFTRSFIFALATALGIHLVLITLFHISPFTIDYNNTVLTPTQVQADGLLIESTIAELNSTIPTIRGLPPLPESYPSLMQNPKFIPYRPITYAENEKSTDVAFTSIEKMVYEPVFIPIIHHDPQNPFQITVSGILGEYVLLSDGRENLSLPLLKTKSTRIVYSVLVEGRTGKIFWFQPLEQTHEALMDKFAETILRKMKFASDPKAIAISGNIEMQFNEGT